MKKIILNNVSKKFKIGFKKNQSPLSKLISNFSGKSPEKEIWALKNISFSVDEGESVGIIGKNGAGKSTLLRVIARIYKHNKGSINTKGRIISLIELGFWERLTMKDNIYLLCSLYNLRKKEIKQKFSSIVDFAELNEYTNTKLYQFSEGMKLRLVSSIAIHCNPDILLIDDVGSVMDKDFLGKCHKANKEKTKKGMSLLIVSHNPEHLKNCSKIIWLENSQIKKIGGKKVLKEYLKNSQ